MSEVSRIAEARKHADLIHRFSFGEVIPDFDLRYSLERVTDALPEVNDVPLTQEGRELVAASAVAFSILSREAIAMFFTQLTFAVNERPVTRERLMQILKDLQR